MKHLFLICVMLSLSISSWAKIQEDIKFIKAERTEDRRSIVIEPTATQEGDVIFISCDLPLQNVQVAVKDAIGDIIYTNTISIPAKGHYSFSLDNAESGSYILEVTIGDSYYYGYFTL